MEIKKIKKPLLQSFAEFKLTFPLLEGSKHSVSLLRAAVSAALNWTVSPPFQFEFSRLQNKSAKESRSSQGWGGGADYLNSPLSLDLLPWATRCGAASISSL